MYSRCIKFLGRLNPKTLTTFIPKTGIPLKDGTRVFNNRLEAIRYGREKIVTALNNPNPYEVSVELKGNKILKIWKGDSTGIGTPLNYKTEADICMHGHPDTYAPGCTTAHSVVDFLTLAKQNPQRAEVVFNSRGEYAFLSKTRGSHCHKVDTQDFSEFDIDYMRTILKACPQNVQQQYEIALKNKDRKKIEDILKMFDMEPKDLTPELCQTTHNFWHTFGQKYGVYYRTNFSNFN